MKITRSIAALSWIDPASGLPEVDQGGQPAKILLRENVLGEQLYRFAQLLEATIETTGNQIAASYFTMASGMYRGPSFLGIPSDPVGTIGRSKKASESAVVFKQVVGCRTKSPETIGKRTGIGFGLATFWIAGPWPAVLGGVIGHETAEAITAFPPIWSELELTINVDGSFTHRLLRHSLFPSCSCYAIHPATNNYVRQDPSYNGVPNLQRWNKQGWGPAVPGTTVETAGSPWKMVVGVGCNTPPNAIPAGY